MGNIKVTGFCALCMVLLNVNRRWLCDLFSAFLTMQLASFVRVLLFWGIFMTLAEAHTVPTLVVEAEFAAHRTATFRVNLDPRLFLSAQPTSLPPVPASWWFDQDEKAQEESRKKANDAINHLLAFKVGDTRVHGDWKTSPIDSASAFPLEATSAEVHLLAEFTGPIPDSEGPFTLQVSQDCPVGLILVNSLEGIDQRKPQSLFGGETSVGYALPALIRAEVKNPPSHWLWLAILALPLLLMILKLRKR
ncbi:hypothetical protein BH11VER1_BH11VER1_17720 [soil metagenome]